MAAPKGNQFWKARSSHGRKPKFRKADDLWDACQQYFEWVEANPLWEMKPFAYQGDVIQEPVAKMRAMTISGLCVFLDIERTTWEDYRNRKGFHYITARVEAIIRDQKFAGAAAELLNPNIIARDLGLVDKQQSSVSIKPEAENVSEVDAWLEGIANGETAGTDPKARTH